MKEKIQYLFKSIRSLFKFMKYMNRSKKNPNAIAADLIRNTHSVEKGLSIQNIRLGFGHKKQIEMIESIQKLEKYNVKYYNEVISMAISSMDEYVKYHQSRNYSDEFLKKMKIFIQEHENMKNKLYGGTITLDTNQIAFDITKIENFIKLRHSIRNFTKEPVKDDLIKKAILLAQHCPSACNRQGVRAYIIDREKAKPITSKIEGIRGFADSIDKLILITAKISSYKFSEINQYIVSPSIFAGYLSLTLHLYGLGACLIQRPVIWNKTWKNIKKLYNIEDDEQIICMMGVGNINGKIKVPISHRLDMDEFARFIK